MRQPCEAVMPAIGPLVEAVQGNCDIADARHATELTLCNYLLQMRELFRWERGLSFTAALPRAEVGAWIARREGLWEQHAGRDFAALALPGGGPPVDPFAVDLVNARLQRHGLLYGAGLAVGARPVFFLAHCHAIGHREGLRVQQAGHELARGLLAPPAVLAGGGDGPVVLRRESMARACWERYEGFRLRPAVGTAFAAVVQAYGFDDGFEAALPRWLDEHVEVALLHELGEFRAGQALGPHWGAMRGLLRSRRAELLLRAVRDHLADLGTTLPALTARGAAAPLHAWFADYEGLREVLYPALGGAYRAWRDGDGGRQLEGAIERGRTHFTALAAQLLTLHARAGDAAVPSIEALLTGDEAVCRATAVR